MSKFKVGNRVRVRVERVDRCSRPFISIGSIGVVDCERKGERGPLVNLEGGPFLDVGDGFEYPGGGWAYDESELELIND